MSNQPTDSSIRITRGQLGQFGSFFGAFFMLLAILGWIWQGSLSLAILISAFLGLAGTGLWAFMTPQEFRDFVTGRQVRQSTSAIFSTLLLFGIVTLVYIFVQREVIVADMTIDARFSLSQSTAEILRAVERSPRDIQIMGFYPASNILQREIDDQYFQLYESNTSGKITRRYVDPNAEPGLSARYMSAIAQGVNIFIGFLNPDGSLDSSSVVAAANTGSQERDITEALARLLVQGQFKVYFERGLDTLDPIDNSQEGMSLLNNYMRSTGVISEAISLQELVDRGQQIPADASAIVIIRPRREPNASEIALLDEYLQRGGALFIGADVFSPENAFMGVGSAFNDFLWTSYGLRMTDMIVVDPISSGQSQLEVLSAGVVAENEIAANINLEGDPNTATLFQIARAIEVDPDPPVQNGSVIISSPSSWGESNWEDIYSLNQWVYDEADDAPGPLTTVAFALDADTQAKIVLIGDGNFAMNGQAVSPEGNAILFLDSIGWMTGFSQEVRFEPRAFTTTPVLFVGGQALDLILFITVIFLPGLMLVAALAVWARRLRQ